MVDTFQLGRFTISTGDAVSVLASRPGKKDGFKAIVKGARLNDDGVLEEVYIYGGRNTRKGPILSSRTFTPDRIRYMQPKTQKPVQDAAARFRDRMPKPLPPKGRKHGR